MRRCPLGPLSTQEAARAPTYAFHAERSSRPAPLSCADVALRAPSRCLPYARIARLVAGADRESSAVVVPTVVWARFRATAQEAELVTERLCRDAPGCSLQSCQAAGRDEAGAGSRRLRSPRSPTCRRRRPRRGRCRLGPTSLPVPAEGDRLLDPTRTVGVAHREHVERGELDVQGGRAGPPCGRRRGALLLGQCFPGRGDRGPQGALAAMQVAVAAIAVGERLRLLDLQQLVDVAVEVLVPAVVLAARRGVEAAEQRVEIGELGPDDGAS